MDARVICNRDIVQSANKNTVEETNSGYGWAGPHLADYDVSGLKVAAVHLGRLPRDGLDLHADLLALLGRVHRLVVHLDTGNYADVDELEPQRQLVSHLVTYDFKSSNLPIYIFIL